MSKNIFDQDEPRNPTVFILSEEQFEAVQRDQRAYQSAVVESMRRPMPGVKLVLAVLVLAVAGAFVLTWRDQTLKAKGAKQ